MYTPYKYARFYWPEVSHINITRNNISNDSIFCELPVVITLLSLSDDTPIASKLLELIGVSWLPVTRDRMECSYIGAT